MTIALLLCLFTAQADDTPKVLVKDGHCDAILYGWSPVLDLWGNARKQVWTLRADGTLLFRTPEGSLEDYLKRDLTAEEKEHAGTYSISGEALDFSFKDGSTAKGTVEYADDRSIKQIKANSMYFFAVNPGVNFKLEGYWSNTSSFSNAAYKMTTTSYNNYSFFANGLFVHESGAGTIATAVRERTTERTSGNDVIVETIRSEVSKFYGGEAPKNMGKFRVEGSALILEYDSGKKATRCLARIGGVSSDGTRMILLDGAIYEGTAGKFPGKGPDAVPAPVALAQCTADQFDLAVPAAWTAREEKSEQGRFFVLSPVGEQQLAVVLMGTTIEDKKAQAGNSEIIKSLEGLVAGWVKEPKIAPDSAPGLFSIDGVEAVSIRYTLKRDTGTVKLVAVCAVREGAALVVFTISSEEAQKKYGDAVKALTASIKIGRKSETVRCKAADFELDVPKTWESKNQEEQGVKSTLLIPPGRKGAVDGEFVAQLMVAPVEDGYKSADEEKAVADLRELIKELSPNVEQQGELEKLKADGTTAVHLRYAGKTADGSVIVVEGTMVVKHEKALILLLVCKESLAKEHRAALRKAFESISVKK